MQNDTKNYFAMKFKNLTSSVQQFYSNAGVYSQRKSSEGTNFDKALTKGPSAEQTNLQSSPILEIANLRFEKTTIESIVPQTSYPKQTLWEKYTFSDVVMSSYQDIARDFLRTITENSFPDIPPDELWKKNNPVTRGKDVFYF